MEESSTCYTSAILHLQNTASLKSPSLQGGLEKKEREKKKKQAKIHDANIYRAEKQQNMIQEVDDSNRQKETVCARHGDYMAAVVKLQLTFYFFFFFFNSTVHLLLQWINALTNSHSPAAAPGVVEDGLVFRLYCVLVDSNQDTLRRETLATNNCVCFFVVFPSAAYVHRNTPSPILISFFF